MNYAYYYSGIVVVSMPYLKLLNIWRTCVQLSNVFGVLFETTLTNVCYSIVISFAAKYFLFESQKFRLCFMSEIWLLGVLRWVLSLARLSRCRLLFFMWGIPCAVYSYWKNGLLFSINVIEMSLYCVRSMHWLTHTPTTTIFIDILNCDAHAQFQPNTFFPSCSPFIPSQFNSVARMSLLQTRMQSPICGCLFFAPLRIHIAFDGEQVGGVCVVNNAISACTA